MSQDEPAATSEAAVKPDAAPDAAPDTAAKAETSAPTGWRRLWHDWIRPILTVIIVLYAFRTTIMDWNDVPSGSMEPTIHPGDRIVVNKLSYDITIPYTNIKIYRWGGPARGDIVVFLSPTKDRTRLVKRVIGLPGDRIAMEGKQLLVNGTPVQYEWSDEIELIDTVQTKNQPFRRGVEHLPDHEHALMIYPDRVADINRWMDEIVIPEGKYFMMGDNRDDSKDSRYFGFVDRDLIEGRAFAVALSFDYANSWKPRWERWFSKLK